MIGILQDVAAGAYIVCKEEYYQYIEKMLTREYVYDI